jgi:hypothetical protein
MSKAKSSQQKKNVAKPVSESKHRHVKVGITIPNDAFQRIEEARAELGYSRSQFLLIAVQDWFSGTKRQNLADQYVSGYEQKPEDAAFSISLESAQITMLDHENW